MQERVKERVDPMNYNLGDRVGDYEIVGILGAGGMGRVYKVRNVISDRIEAMKILLPDLAGVPELADRFTREIKVLAALDHPNIAALRTAQSIGNQLIMIMELVEGETLEEKLKAGPLPVAAAVDYASQVLSALSYAHARGVIHRDIKPANMMVTAGGLVKLMDFGIARAAGDRKLTMTGTTMGSLYYMSPEQIKGGELDARSDLYSFGVSLYELATGARPFRGDSDFSIMSAHLEKQPVPPVEVDPKLPAALNEIILMSISKDPAKRFQSADAFAAALRSVGGARPAAAAPSPAPAAAPPRPAATRPSHRGLYMALGAVVGIAVLAVGAMQLPKWFGTRAGEPAAQEQQAVPAAEPPAVTAAEPPAVTAAPEVPPAGVTPQAGQPATPAPAAIAEPPRRQPPVVREAPAVRQPAASPAAATTVTPQRAVVEPPSAAAPAPEPARPAADAARAAAMRELQKSWPMLASRAGAVSSSLKTLQQQQQRSGFGLRGDIAASWKRMEYYMDQFDAAMAAKDPDAAREHMENAEREIANLEKFLGR